MREPPGCLRGVMGQDRGRFPVGGGVGELGEHRRLERLERPRILRRQHQKPVRAQAVLDAFLALRALPAAVVGPRDLAPLMRRASARGDREPTQWHEIGKDA